MDYILLILGFVLLIKGADFFVDGSSSVAKLLKVPSIVIGLTVVAFGTSLPELVTSVSAARKGDVGIATGNIIGSNIANILLIGGLGAICTGSAGLPFSTEGLVSGLVSLAAAIFIFLSCQGKSGSIGRVAGIIMLVGLVLYYGFVLANALSFHIY